MKKSEVTIKIHGKSIKLPRGHWANVYYTEKGPCGPNKPLRYKRVENGKEKSSYHSIDEIDELRKHVEDINAAWEKRTSPHLVSPTLDEACAILSYRMFWEKQKNLFPEKDPPTFSSIVDSAIEQVKARRVSPSISSVAKEYIEEKRELGMSDEHLKSLERYFRRFAENLNDIMVGDVTIGMAEDFFKGLRKIQEPRTVKGYYINIKALFNWGFKHVVNKKLKDGEEPLRNPLEDLDIAFKKVIDDPKIISPDTLKKVLEQTRRNAPDLLPNLVLQAFCGVRMTEANRLMWTDLSADTNYTPTGEVANFGYVDLSRKLTKTKEPRNPPIPENAKAWLMLSKDRKPEKFIVAPAVKGSKRAKKLKYRVSRYTSGLGIPFDGLRHSCSTYLAALRGSEKSAEICGHLESTAKASYRVNVSYEMADKWLHIFPDKI